MKTIDITKLPTEFRACSWDDGWEFEAPLVVYYPKAYRCYAHVGSVHEAERVVEDICIDISCGSEPNDGGLAEDCEWRHWDPNGFARRKAARHVVIKGKWEESEDGPLWTQTSMKVTDGPPR